MHTTSASLLERLRRPNEQPAWERFVFLYTPLLLHWFRRLGLQDSDASDAVQDVFAILLRELPRFQYEPGKRFRGWLWTVTLNQFRQRRRKWATDPLQANDAALQTVATPDETQAVDESEYRRFVIERGMDLMRSEFQPITWKACWEYAVVGRPSAEVAAELGISVNAVHLAKSRVLRRLRQELAGLVD